MKLMFLSLACYFVGFQASYVPNPVPKARHQFIVIAHRGDHINYPENTLAAYAQAIKDGADYVEIDLRTTKDGKLISLHNETVDRMTNGTGLVSELTFDAIKKLSIKAINNAQPATYTIPGFEEILALCKNKINIYIDFKEADPAVAFAILKGFKMEKQVLVYINKPEQLTAWRRVAPQIPLMLSLPETVNDSIGMVKFIELAKPDLLDGNYKQYTPQLTAIAKSHQLPLWPDAQSQAEGPEVWQDAINKGLVGLQTDHPQLLINYLKHVKLR
ncbi:glycerophosphoryl diester phosphodiesterase [Mucilaginibacter gracilis]|uniref:Glycerophosphoryl diester phosphodiesterase n=1 Tax=Mucilaginibacter gracilis TaxID=423350 RepID=A0A495J6A4_9SPHI|nr:glycerophosphodiester phosphodiesterase family protein [Mucilaginibacter gracilis]RKR84263.1 glycerophosphoryl diester phosphodiesterase [Mucilaginibacter gracilis]